MRLKIQGFALVMAFALHASAEQPFPGAIQQAANIPCTPTCVLCHLEVPGTLSNLKQPFASTVLRNGVRTGEPDSLRTVIANLRMKKTDTDGDGKLDVDELAVGSNPNDIDPKAEICGPSYGCGAQLAPPPPPQRAPVMWWLVGLLGAAGLIAARRLRRAE